MLFAHLVQPIQSLQLEAPFTRLASAPPGTQGQMEAHVHRALLAHTKRDLGLLLAQRVRRTPSLLLQATLARHVYANPGTRGKVEARVLCVLLANTEGIDTQAQYTQSGPGTDPRGGRAGQDSMHTIIARSWRCERIRHGCILLHTATHDRAVHL